jgi:fumarate reductase subunit C
MTPPPAEAARYTEFHPRWYRKRVSVYWWLQDWHSLKFILREISSVFVAIAVIGTLLQIHALQQGPESYARFEDRLRTPLGIAITVIVFFFVVFHSITWFNLAPRAMTIRFAGRKVPELLIAAANYGLWMVATLAVVWILLR